MPEKAWSVPPRPVAVFQEVKLLRLPNVRQALALMLNSGSVGVFVWNTPRLVKRIYVEMVGRRKVVLVEPPICERCGSVMLLRARHLERARVTTTAREGMALRMIRAWRRRR